MFQTYVYLTHIWGY